ncbi:synaptogenesis protein syg-2-like isoform X1 [Argiope bruennichi]|uniref:synaptogenesis protein syg-2-like isoform X1 n=1 Tax=Argiope bruennichi TaxID=94029 RepID=UPI002494A315|nr:synaptogenesis protein syg-2-like isoform X1 [Argiope bruennichi]
MKIVFLTLLVLAALLKECIPVRFEYLGVPGFVLLGEPVWLDCGYELEGNELYSVKWYKDNVEFYRYLPSDNPSALMYKLDGVYLDLERSNATHALLYKTEMQTEGMYGCEVSTEMPHFRTIKAEKELYVYVIPEGDPAIFGVMNRYPIGSAVNVTCVFGPSKPAAELTWYINGDKAPEAYVRQRQKEIYQNDLETTKSRLFFVVDPSHLRQGTLSLQCTASVSLVHSKSSIELIVNDGSSGAEFLHVPHVPPGLEGPSITGSVSRYYVGDTVDVNCSSARSLEPAQLQWFVNDNEVKPEFLSQYPPTVYPDGLSSTKLGLRFRVQEDHFRSEEMRLKCTATLAKIITMTTVETIAVGPQRTSGFQVANSAIGWKNLETTTLECMAILTSFLTLYLS